MATKLTRREREKAEFREEVLAAARRIVLEEGFEALTMRKIADAIEYAPGTIYLYFESRDAIAFELCRSGFTELLAALQPAASIADPVERFRDLGRRYVSFGVEHPETYRLIFMDDPKFSSALFEQAEKDPTMPGMQALALLIGVFSELRDRKRLRVKLEPLQLAETTWACVHGIVSLKINNETIPQTSADVMLEQMAEALVATWICDAPMRGKRAH